MGLDAVELIMLIEEEFGVDISHDEASQVRTVGELAGLVLAKLEVDPSSTLAATHLDSLYRLVARQLGVPLSAITPDAHLARDLGAS